MWFVLQFISPEARLSGIKPSVNTFFRRKTTNQTQEEKEAEYRERRRLNRSGLRQALRKRPNLLERQEKYAQQHSRRLADHASVSPLPSHNEQPCWKFELLLACEAEDRSCVAILRVVSGCHVSQENVPTSSQGFGLRTTSQT